MSFLGGAECSTAGNPLSQFTKHVQDDKSLQRDRLVNRGPDGNLHGFRSAVGGSRQQQDEAMNGFLHQSPNLPEMPMAMEHGQIRMDPLSHGVHLRAKSASPSWADDFQSNQAAMEAAFNVPPGTQFNHDEFARFSQMSQASSARSSPMPGGSMAAQQHHHRPMMGVGVVNMGGLGYSMMSPPMFQPPMYQQAQPLLQKEPEQKGKGKVVELDDNKWEEQFAQIELEDKKATEDVDESLAMEPELNKMDEKIMESETGFGDFESIWAGIQAEGAALRSMDDEEKVSADFKFDPTAVDWSDWGQGNSRIGSDPLVQEYMFEEENLFRDQSNPFEEGVRIMNEGGNLSLAALAFEAAVQKEPGHVEAWVQLGSAQAQNEKEDAAIRAREQAIKLDPNNLDALMGLAVSYTNEGYDSTAYRTLERWLSVKYPQIIAPSELSSAAELGFTDCQQLHEKVTELFISAAQLSPDGEQMDPDVQVGLGVLFYGAEEYDKAVDCFRAALDSSRLGASNRQGQAHLLWNRLGATLANSGRSAEAVEAYQRAIELRPNFVRARYNLGISCVNMGATDAAAGHILAALTMHKAVERSGRERAREILAGAGPGGGNDEHLNETLDHMLLQNPSTTLYELLRRVFTLMDRRDFAERVVAGMDPETFRGDFDF